MGKNRGGLFFLFVIMAFAFILLTNLSVLKFFPTTIITSSVTNVATGTVSFNISISQAIIVVRDTFDGVTTNFSIGGNPALRNLSNMALEKTTHGKIIFDELIDITKDAKNKIINLDGNITFINNNLTIDMSELTSLNKSATIYLYSTSFSDPKILRNGEDCPLTVCSVINNSGGILIFNVTFYTGNDFVSYSGVENSTIPPVTPPGGGSSGGGGGAVKKAIEPKFEVDKDSITVKAVVGDTYKTSIKITSLSSKKIDILINNNLKDFILISEKNFTLNPKEEKEIILTFYSSEDTLPDAYVGALNITGAGYTKEIPVIFELESKKKLFDIFLNIPLMYKELYPGENLLLELNLINLGDTKKEKVFILYMIKDLQGNVYFKEWDTVDIDKQRFLSKMIIIPEILKPADYVAIAEISYDDSLGISTEIFRIKHKDTFFAKYKLHILIILILIAIFIFILIVWKKRKTDKDFFKF